MKNEFVHYETGQNRTRCGNRTSGTVTQDIEEVTCPKCLNNLDLCHRAQLRLPVAAQKTTVYMPGTPGKDWVASTNSAVVGLPENQERDESRARFVAIALNNHDELVTSLRDLEEEIQRLKALDQRAFNEADERIIGRARALLVRIEEESKTPKVKAPAE